LNIQITSYYTGLNITCKTSKDLQGVRERALGVEGYQICFQGLQGVFRDSETGFFDSIDRF